MLLHCDVVLFCVLFDGEKSSYCLLCCCCSYSCWCAGVLLFHYRKQHINALPCSVPHRHGRSSIPAQQPTSGSTLVVISQPCLGPRCKGDRHGEEFVLFQQAEASADSYGFDSQQQQQQQRLNRHHTQKTLRVLVADPCLGCYGASEQQTPPERAHFCSIKPKKPHRIIHT